MPNTV